MLHYYSGSPVHQQLNYSHFTSTRVYTHPWCNGKCPLPKQCITGWVWESASPKLGLRLPTNYLSQTEKVGALCTEYDRFLVYTDTCMHAQIYIHTLKKKKKTMYAFVLCMFSLHENTNVENRSTRLHSIMVGRYNKIYKANYVCSHHSKKCSFNKRKASSLL